MADGEEVFVASIRANRVNLLQPTKKPVSKSPWDDDDDTGFGALLPVLYMLCLHANVSSSHCLAAWAAPASVKPRSDKGAAGDSKSEWDDEDDVMTQTTPEVVALKV